MHLIRAFCWNPNDHIIPPGTGVVCKQGATPSLGVWRGRKHADESPGGAARGPEEGRKSFIPRFLGS